MEDAGTLNSVRDVLLRQPDIKFACVDERLVFSFVVGRREGRRSNRRRSAGARPGVPPRNVGRPSESGSSAAPPSRPASCPAERDRNGRVLRQDTEGDAAKKRSSEGGDRARSVAVLGAGIVGISCALHLHRRGFRATLVDRRASGSAHSHFTLEAT